MPKTSRRSESQDGGLHLSVENEDWVAVRGSPDDLKRLGRLLIEFADSKGPDFANLDSPSPLFQPGSLGITLYRTAKEF